MSSPYNLWGAHWECHADLTCLIFHCMSCLLTAGIVVITVEYIVIMTVAYACIYNHVVSSHYNIQVAPWWQCLKLVWLFFFHYPLPCPCCMYAFLLSFIDDDDKFGVYTFSGHKAMFLFLKAFCTLSQLSLVNIFEFPHQLIPW